MNQQGVLCLFDESMSTNFMENNHGEAILAQLIAISCCAINLYCNTEINN